MQLPERFVHIMRDSHGAAGQRWLERLPALLNEVSRRWSLTLGEPFANLSWNYAAPAVRADGTPAVLKLGWPGAELGSELAALRLYAGRGAVAVLEADEARGALLLERALPGTSLVGPVWQDDEGATRIAAEVMRALWRPLPAGTHPFRTLEDWTAGLGRVREHFAGTTGPLPEPLVARAEAYRVELLASAASQHVLLHGDLHYDNILAAQRAPWLAIDPKGIAGDPAYEPAPLMYNPHGIETHPDLARLLRRRLDVLAEMLGFERERLRRWSVVQAVLSGWWNIEDLGRGWEPALRFAEVLENECGG